MEVQRQFCQSSAVSQIPERLCSGTVDQQQQIHLPEEKQVPETWHCLLKNHETPLMQNEAREWLVPFCTGCCFLRQINEDFLFH